MNNFQHRYINGLETSLDVTLIAQDGNLTAEERTRLERIREAYDFYEGYHWENIPDYDDDSAKVTLNYCRPFVNKFVAFEMGHGFVINTPKFRNEEVTVGQGTVREEVSENDTPFDLRADTKEVVHEKTTLDFLNSVWEDNNKALLCTEIGQSKSISGDAWIKVDFEEPDAEEHVFEEHPDGRIDISVIPTQYVFPRFDRHNKKKVTSLLIMYPIDKEQETGLLFRSTKITQVLYKEYWTAKTIEVYEGDTLIDSMENPYGFIPFVQIRNFPLIGRVYGIGDLDDIIPLNVELNTKRSDISEIIDYHAAPVTCVFGAKIGNLEKGANKVWGGLPKDAKIQNLGLDSDLSASTSYTETIKTSMCEIGSVPETVLGGAQAISNTSGVAMQYMNLPLSERVDVKWTSTKPGLELVNKMILFIGMTHGLITKPDDVSMRDFLHTEVKRPDPLPKDELIELQKIQQRLLLGLECRHGAMESLNIDNISDKIAEIDKEREEHPELFNPALATLYYQNQLNSGLNSGMTNGETPVEQVRREVMGENGFGSGRPVGS